MKPCLYKVQVSQDSLISSILEANKVNLNRVKCIYSHGDVNAYDFLHSEYIKSKVAFVSVYDNVMIIHFRSMDYYCANMQGYLIFVPEKDEINGKLRITYVNNLVEQQYKRNLQ